MRIIRILVALVALWAIFMAQAALAAEVGTNETNTNFKIQDNIEIINGIAYDRANILAYTPYNFDGYEPVKSSEESKREKMLSRFEEKRRNTVFPEGQFTINASAYTAAADECGKSDGITASGLKVMENHTIACPPQFPLGTKLKIDGLGTYVCEDRGGAIKGNHIDIYVKTKTEAFAFGRQNLLAEVVM